MSTCPLSTDLLWPMCTTKLVGRYKVDQSKISVSGFSSGAAMATQMHVSYSSVFMGVGVLAGGEHNLRYNVTVIKLILFH